MDLYLQVKCEGVEETALCHLQHFEAITDIAKAIPEAFTVSAWDFSRKVQEMILTRNSVSKPLSGVIANATSCFESMICTIEYNLDIFVNIETR